MSLDVYLKVPGVTLPAGSGIFVRDGGRTVEISEAEWRARRPDREPVRYTGGPSPGVAFHRNITHNLGTMAEAAGIYDCLWRPDEVGVTTARQLILPLHVGLGHLLTDPERFRALNPPNGWGDYGGLVEFVRAYLAACEQYPDAEVEVSR